MRLRASKDSRPTVSSAICAYWSAIRSSRCPSSILMPSSSSPPGSTSPGNVPPRPHPCPRVRLVILISPMTTSSTVTVPQPRATPLTPPAARHAVGANGLTVLVDGVTLAYEDEGQGPPVVCLHALGHGARDYEALAARLRGR